MPRLRKFVADLGAVDLLVHFEPAPGEARQHLDDALELLFAVAPGTRLVVASAPALTIGFMVRSR